MRGSKTTANLCLYFLLICAEQVCILFFVILNHDRNWLDQPVRSNFIFVAYIFFINIYFSQHICTSLTCGTLCHAVAWIPQRRVVLEVDFSQPCVQALVYIAMKRQLHFFPISHFFKFAKKTLRNADLNMVSEIVNICIYMLT